MSDLKCKTFHPLYMPLVSSGLLKPDWNEGRVFSFLFSGSAKAINYIYSNFFLRYTLSNITPILMNINSRIKFTDRCSLIVFPSTAIPERLPIKNICEISFHIFLYCFIVSIIITIKICMIIRALIIYTLLYLLLNRLRIVHLKICRLIVIYKPHIDIIYFMKSNFLNL